MAKKLERFLLRIIKGGFQPADQYTASRLREKGYSVGDVLMANLVKPRNPKFHNLMHRFGFLVSQNIDDFNNMDAHSVIKRLQYEANVSCDTLGVKLAGIGYVEVRQPRSLSFTSMDEGAFKETFRGLSRHVSEHYWTDLSAEQIEEMAEAMVDEA